MRPRYVDPTLGRRRGRPTHQTPFDTEEKGVDRRPDVLPPTPTLQGRSRSPFYGTHVPPQIVRRDGSDSRPANRPDRSDPTGLSFVGVSSSTTLPVSFVTPTSSATTPPTDPDETDDSFRRESDSTHSSPSRATDRRGRQRIGRGRPKTLGPLLPSGSKSLGKTDR